MLTFHKCSYKYSYMTLAGHCIGFHRTEPFQEEKQQQMNVLYNPSLALALISLSSQPETSELPPLHFICMLCGLWPLLFSGALMWNCTGQSAAPCPAVSAGVSCGVWAEADGPGVQGVPVPQCSPASSQALRTKCRRRTRGEHMVTRNGFLLPHRHSVLFSCTSHQTISGLFHNFLHLQNKMCLHSSGTYITHRGSLYFNQEYQSLLSLLSSED